MVLVLAFARVCLPELIKDGLRWVPLEVRILNPENRPIAGAKVWALPNRYNEEPTDEELGAVCPPRITGGEGKARLCLVCGAGWSSGLFGKRGNFVVSQTVLIKAEGYRTISGPLSNFVGGYRQPLKKRELEMEVRMLR